MKKNEFSQLRGTSLKVMPIKKTQTGYSAANTAYSSYNEGNNIPYSAES